LERGDTLFLGFLAGFVLGLTVGLGLAYALLGGRPEHVLFERDEQGRITSIHYVSG